MDTTDKNDMVSLDETTEQPNYEVAADMLALPAPRADVETPLAAADEQALEAGIALMFESLLHSDAVYIAPEEDHVEPTYALLDELNRLWALAA